MAVREHYRLLVCAGLLFIAVVLTLRWYSQLDAADTGSFLGVVPDTPEMIAAERVEQERIDRIRRGGKHYQPLQLLVDYPGVENAEIVDASDAPISKSEPIIGISVQGQQYAFVLSALRDPQHHIANLLLQDTPVSVTYCDLSDCVRVLTSQERQAISLHVGGLDISNQLVLMLGGDRFSHLSDELPLEDYPFQRMNWGQWEVMHPSTKVYIGPESS